jgi:hypothetical protein
MAKWERSVKPASPSRATRARHTPGGGAPDVVVRTRPRTPFVPVLRVITEVDPVTLLDRAAGETNSTDPQ